MDNLDDIDNFLSQLKKKKKRADNSVKKKVINDVPKVIDDIKEESVGMFVTQKKNKKLQKLASLHANSEVMFNSLDDDYESPVSKPKIKRVFKYTPKPMDEPRVKPVVIDQEEIEEKPDHSKGTVYFSAPADSHANPDLYFGISSTLQALEAGEGDISSNKPIFDANIQKVGVDLPSNLQD